MAKFVGHIGKKLPDDVIAKLEELAAHGKQHHFLRFYMRQ